jgi:phosphoglycerate dehydrogenase-like enzyme
MQDEVKNQIKTLGIIGFGKEGQAIFQHYKNQFDQIFLMRS